MFEFLNDTLHAAEKNRPGVKAWPMPLEIGTERAYRLHNRPFALMLELMGLTEEEAAEVCGVSHGEIQRLANLTLNEEGNLEEVERHMGRLALAQVGFVGSGAVRAVLPGLHSGTIRQQALAYPAEVRDMVEQSNSLVPQLSRGWGLKVA